MQAGAIATSKLNRFLAELEFPSSVNRFWPTFFVIMCTFSNELLNVRARRTVKVPDVSRHFGRCPKFLNLSLSISSSYLECIAVTFLLNYRLPKHFVNDCNTLINPN